MNRAVPVYTALNWRDEEVQISTIDELMGMIAAEWKRGQQAKRDLAEAEFYAKTHRLAVTQSTHRLGVLARILGEMGTDAILPETEAQPQLNHEIL